METIADIWDCHHPFSCWRVWFCIFGGNHLINKEITQASWPAFPLHLPQDLRSPVWISISSGAFFSSSPAHHGWQRTWFVSGCVRWHKQKMKSHYSCLLWSFITGMASLTKSGQVSVTWPRRLHRPCDTSMSVSTLAWCIRGLKAGWHSWYWKIQHIFFINIWTYV